MRGSETRLRPQTGCSAHSVGMTRVGYSGAGPRRDSAADRLLATLLGNDKAVAIRTLGETNSAADGAPRTLLE